MQIYICKIRYRYEDIDTNYIAIGYRDFHDVEIYTYVHVLSMQMCAHQKLSLRHANHNFQGFWEDLAQRKNAKTQSEMSVRKVEIGPTVNPFKS